MTGPSVLTLVKNREPHLRQLVEGLRRSTLAPSELIVIDMSDSAVTLPPTDFPTRLLRHPAEGLPLAAARNLAAAAASADDLVFLDVDCIPLASCLARLVETLAEHDALLCADTRYLGSDDARGAWTEAELLAAGTPHPVRDFPATGCRHEDNPGLFWSLAFAVRATRFHALGGFDEAFTGYGAEDTDLGVRTFAAGVPLLFVGGAIACHQWHESDDPPIWHLADIVRNARTFHAKHGWWPMHGWLRAFADRGLVRWTEDTLSLVE